MSICPKNRMSKSRRDKRRAHCPYHTGSARLAAAITKERLSLLTKRVKSGRVWKRIFPFFLLSQFFEIILTIFGISCMMCG